MTRRRLFLRALLVSGAAFAPAARVTWATAASRDHETAASLLAAGGDGLVIVMRHALAPGTFDPPGFRLDDCSTQRNLGEEGREQARRIGGWYRERGLAPRAVRSSQWCRCLDTARLAFGAAEPWPTLNSLIGEQARQSLRTAALRAELARLFHAGEPGFEVWVTHQVNISALTDNHTASGDAVLVRHDPVSGLARVLGVLRLE